MVPPSVVALMIAGLAVAFKSTMMRSFTVVSLFSQRIDRIGAALHAVLRVFLLVNLLLPLSIPISVIGDLQSIAIRPIPEHLEQLAAAIDTTLNLPLSHLMITLAQLMVITRVLLMPLSISQARRAAVVPLGPLWLFRSVVNMALLVMMLSAPPLAQFAKEFPSVCGLPPSDVTLIFPSLPSCSSLLSPILAFILSSL